MIRAVTIVAGAALTLVGINGCAATGAPSHKARPGASSPVTSSGPLVKATSGHASARPQSCSFLDDRPDLLAALSLADVRPRLRTDKAFMTGCDWVKQGSRYVMLLTDYFVFATEDRKDARARSQRAYRRIARDCASPVQGFAHPQGLTWEEGCLNSYDKGPMLTVRRGNVHVTVSYYGPVTGDRLQERTCLQIAQVMLESIKWSE